MCTQNALKGGSPLKITKTRFQDNGWPKRSTQWANFLIGFGGPRPLGVRVVATPIFPPKVAQKFVSKKSLKMDKVNVELNFALNLFIGIFEKFSGQILKLPGRISEFGR